MWTTTMQYLHAPTAYTNGSDGTPQNLLATGTAYKQVQIYDIRTASTTRRPVLYTPEKLLSHRTTALCQLPDGNTLAVGDAAGDCHLLDLRHMHYGHVNANRLRKKAAEEIGLGRLVGPGGSIRQLAVHPTLPYLACVGLDRKLWTWDVTRRKMVDCVYLKQKLNCVLFCEDGSWDGMNGDVAEEEREQDGSGEETEAAGDKRGRGLAEEDDVEDYVDSEDETEAGQSNHNAASNGGGRVGNGTKQQKESSSTSSEETASGSSEGDGEGSDEDGDESDDGESDSSEEKDPASSSTNPTKRRRK
jgi:ribosome biogenesis protein NSA1